MNAEPDDNTLDNAGPIGKRVADALSAKVIEGVQGFPDSDDKQRVAIARITARNIDDWADEVER